MPATILEQNLRDVRERIERAARAAGRDPGQVRLLPVTKSVSADVALELFRLGERELSENRLEGLEDKRARFEQAGAAARWHFIGHLQRNKARRVVRLADAIDSVDSLRLIETLERVAAEEGRRPELHLEVKLSGEAAKHGLAPEELEAAVRAAGAAPHLTLVGLMTMAPLEEDEDARESSARAVFERLAGLARELEADAGLAACFQGGRVELSMGMSGDFEQAVAAGSHVVRVGSALFEGLPHDRGAAPAQAPAEVDR